MAAHSPPDSTAVFVTEHSLLAARGTHGVSLANGSSELHGSTFTLKDTLTCSTTSVSQCPRCCLCRSSLGRPAGRTGRTCLHAIAVGSPGGVWHGSHVAAAIVGQIALYS